jgi:predicted Zn-dependent peptidase
MFLNVREAQGLCYYIRTDTDDYTDVGVISTTAGVDLKRLPNAITAIKAEYDSLVEKGPTETELRHAKEFLKGKLTLRLEDSEEYAHLIGKQHLLYKQQLTLPEIFKKIDSTTISDIQKLAQNTFTKDKLRLACIGPFEGEEEKLARLVRNSA